ncbi:MAG: hypothetical protein LKM37_06140 [Bacteroidales bacterium]|jgi:hypothetical protein|nr:hypothetical protein [Bacteroidales bacterium]
MNLYTMKYNSSTVDEKRMVLFSATNRCTVSGNKYVAPCSKIIQMEPEGFIATSGDLPDYGDGGSLSQVYPPKPVQDNLIKKA